MKNKLRNLAIWAITALFGLLILGSSPALAAGGSSPSFNGIQCNGPAKDSPVCSASGKDPLTGKNGVIVKATRLIAFVAGAAAVIIIIVSGISFITSSGDAGKASKARETIIYATVGLAVIVLSQEIITFVVSRV